MGYDNFAAEGKSFNWAGITTRVKVPVLTDEPGMTHQLRKYINLQQNGVERLLMYQCIHRLSNFTLINK